MVSLSTWFRYVAHKFEYSVSLGLKNYEGGQFTNRELLRDFVGKNFFQGKLTYLHWNKGEEMAPTIAGKGETLLVRKLPTADPAHVFVGDVVILKDPEKTDNYLVRRLSAIEGYEMVSTNEKDEPFVLEKDQCWVVADNKNLKAKEANDSRSFGPVNMTDIVGRVIYCLQNAVEHGRVLNSHFSMRRDSPVLAVELDVDEMSKNHKA
ncbi:mitochondrial ATP-independent inner membrane protease subunit 2-like [Gastrolobium bilobum]|uniref:mitochondrial ATP-independent inner membrane protease subunit 2-like n=1 Tax=Gastrolobium bilobum TaxID=150636 RepID=UPI002AB22D0C|nr:mitochondrial ATP-independent inner membrane protease subunit 2-like [Gastrolobium bilobum]